LVFPEGFGSYQAELGSRVQQALVKAGYACMQVLVPGTVSGGKCRYDVSSLKFTLGYHVDFAILFFDSSAAARILNQHGIAYAMVGCGEKEPPGCVGSVGFDYSSAADALVQRCRRLKIKSAVQICKGGAEYSLARRLSSAGVKVTVMKVKANRGRSRGRLWELQQATLDLFREWRSGNSEAWPDMIYVTDDYVASAALLALEHLRVQIPREVRLVVFSNRGFGPVAWGSLARIENDASEHGAVVSKGVLEFLDSGIFPGGLRLSASFVGGDSFPD
jgi:DNA-binding LacI/PurR family transcriptional regulator